MKDTRHDRDLVEARERANRAKVYADKFPQFAKPDSPYTTVEWQLSQLQAWNEKCAPSKT